MPRMERMPVMLPAFEKAAIERQAAAAGMSISAWVRQRLTADLTGDLLAQQVATLVGQHTDQELQKLATALDEHRVIFESFRAGLRTSIQQLGTAIAALQAGEKS